ncbi:hypothetical protein GCM10009801_05250 [Streptomyces albiaxialis]|uniref:Uncharacterized protein n=1 Tax=Streptomyces albiaxialis TaxID=329523 RepID=A0ABP5H3Q3_9ACTN
MGGQTPALTFRLRAQFPALLTGAPRSALKGRGELRDQPRRKPQTATLGAGQPLSSPDAGHGQVGARTRSGAAPLA